MQMCKQILTKLCFLTSEPLWPSKMPKAKTSFSSLIWGSKKWVSSIVSLRPHVAKEPQLKVGWYSEDWSKQPDQRLLRSDRLDLLTKSSPWFNQFNASWYWWTSMVPFWLLLTADDGTEASETKWVWTIFSSSIISSNDGLFSGSGSQQRWISDKRVGGAPDSGRASAGRNPWETIAAVSCCSVYVISRTVCA